MVTPPWLRLASGTPATGGAGGAPAPNPTPPPPVAGVVGPATEQPRKPPQDPATGRFVKGPGAGRMVGSKNKVTLAIENMLDGEGERISRKCIDLALAGDTFCIKLVLDRVAPVRKGRPIPTIAVKKDEGKIEALLRAVLEGEITPEEGKTVVELIESAARCAADQALADIRRRQHDVLQRVGSQAHSGIMIIPMASPKEWEVMAVESQHLLKSAVRE